jgi:DNA mismatch repair protein MutL
LLSAGNRESLQAITGLLNTYILYPNREGLWLIDQQRAHERILYEQLEQSSAEKPIATQRSMFPVTLSLPAADAVLLSELRAPLTALGFLLEVGAQGEFIIQGTPSDMQAGQEKQIIEKLLEEYKHFNSDAEYTLREKLIRSMVKQRCIKIGTPLTEKEMQELVMQLLACKYPGQTPDGKPTYLSINKDYLDRFFGR